MTRYKYFRVVSPTGKRYLRRKMNEEKIATECIIKHMVKMKRIKKGCYKNEDFYTVEIYTPNKRRWNWRTSFMEKTKKGLLWRLKEEYML